MAHLAMCNGARIVGAMASSDNRAPFVRAPFVVEISEENVGIERHISGAVEGDSLAMPEWEALLAQREAIRLEWAPPFEPGLRLWIFRGDFAMSIDGVVATLSRAGLWVADGDCWPHDKRRGFVRDGQCNGFRKTWADAELESAERAMRRGDLRYALACAQTAFHLEPRMSPRATALLAHAYRLVGNTTRAEGYVRSAEQSFGAVFARAVREELSRLVTIFPGDGT